VLQIAFLLVVCSGLLNATWNLFTKKSINKAVFLWLIHAIAAILYMPSFLYELFTTQISATGYGMIVISLLFQSCYIWLVAKAYSIGDLSQVYPIMRGTGALLVPIIGVTFMNESIAGVGWAGLGILLLGMFYQSNLKRDVKSVNSSSSVHAVLLAFAIGLCTTGYTLTDKVTLQHISPIALIQVSHIGYMLSLTWGVLRCGQIKKEWTTNWKTILLGALIAPGSYLLFLFAMDLGEVSKLAPIREIGVVFGTIFGIVILKEKQASRRITGAILIVIGVILLQGFG
jgi:uncharacterized membrane protein